MMLSFEAFNNAVYNSFALRHSVHKYFKVKPIDYNNFNNSYFQILRKELQLSSKTIYGAKEIPIAGKQWSLDDIEHGIIRANTKHPYQFFRLPFPKSNDPRRSLCVSTLDPRIHFALNCGANSCPPISTYTPEALDEESLVPLSIDMLWYSKNDDDENEKET